MHDKIFLLEIWFQLSNIFLQFYNTLCYANFRVNFCTYTSWHSAVMSKSEWNLVLILVGTGMVCQNAAGVLVQ